MNEDWLTVERWKSTQLLTPFKESQQQSAVNCLGAQIAFNNVENNPPDFMRCVIPVLIRTLPHSEAFARNHFEPGLSEQTPTIHLFNTKFDSSSVQGLTQIDGRCENHNMQAEADYVAKFSTAFRKEFDELFSDQVNKNIYFHGLRANKAGTVCLHYNL